MEIRNNYSTGMSVLKAKNTNNQHNNKAINQTANYSDVSFQAVSFAQFLKPITNLKKNYKMNRPFEITDDAAAMIGDFRSFLGETTKKGLIEEFTQIAKEEGLKNKSWDFLSAMLARAQYYGKETEQGKKPIIDLFARVKDPREIHIAFVEDSPLSMDDVKKCFDVCEDNPRMIEHLYKISGEIGRAYNFKKDIHEKVLCDLVNSKDATKLIENYGATRDYIKKHGKDKGSEKTIIRGLEESFNSGTIGTDTKKKELDTILQYFPKTEKPVSEIFLPHYSETGNEVLKLLNGKFKTVEESNPDKVAQSYLHIYQTTTPENKRIRTRFIEKNYIDHNHRKDTLPDDEVENLAKLFDIIDNDKKAYTFIANSMNYRQNDMSPMLQRAGAYVELFEKYNSADLAKKSNKILSRVQNAQTLDEKMERIDEVLSDKVSHFDVLLALFGRKRDQVKAVKKINALEHKQEEPKGPVYPTVVAVRPLIQNVAKEKPTKFVYPSLAELNKKNLADMISATPRKASVDRKLKIAQSSVSPLLRKHIKSERVLNEQEFLYTKNATKLRASMLPDIFESIKVTRAQAKAADGKLPKGFVKNEDAIDLYNKINGKNKKLVKYMLKQTKENAEGKKERVFNVKDIIETLDSANKEIFEARAKATKDARFTAKDEKELYDRMLKDIMEREQVPLSKTSRK